MARSRPMLLVRSAPGGAEQNEPAPCVGHTWAWSGSVSSRCKDRYWARARSSVRSGATRSVRAAAPTSSDPPVKTPTGRVPSSSRNARCSSVCPGVVRARSRSPPRSTSSASPRPVCANSLRPAAEASTVAPSVAASWTAPERKSACRCVSAAKASRSPRRPASRRTTRTSLLASTTSARPSPRSTRYALLPSPASTSGTTAGPDTTLPRPTSRSIGCLNSPGQGVRLSNESLNSRRVRWVHG